MRTVRVTSVLIIVAFVAMMSISSHVVANPKDEAKSSAMKMKDSKAGEMKSSPAGETGEMSEAQAEMMAKWAEASAPNENHKVLNSLVGDWNHEVKWWMSPDGEPEVSKGTSQIKWVMDGRFLQHDVQGTSMGQPFEGRGTIGYDNVKKEYVSTWLDSMSTGMMIGKGKYDPAARTITEEGKYSCPFHQDANTFRSVTKIISDNQFTYEMYSRGMGDEVFRTMEITYTRAN